MSCKMERMNMWKVSKTEVDVYCRSGALLTGFIKEFDEDSFILDELLVFFNAVTSIKPKNKKR